MHSGMQLIIFPGLCNIVAHLNNFPMKLDIHHFPDAWSNPSLTFPVRVDSGTTAVWLYLVQSWISYYELFLLECWVVLTWRFSPWQYFISFVAFWPKKLARFSCSRCSRRSLSAMNPIFFFAPRDLQRYGQANRYCFANYEFMLEQFAKVTQEVVTWRNGCKYVDYCFRSDAFPNKDLVLSTKHRPNLEWVMWIMKYW